MKTKLPIALVGPSSLKHNAGRYADRLSSPGPRGMLGRPSRWLSDREKEIWRELVRSSPCELGESDRILVELVCVLRGRLERRAIDSTQIVQLISALGKLGMVAMHRKPASHTKETNEWADFNEEFGHRPKTPES